MTTTNPVPIEDFYDVPSWYERPKLPKGQARYGRIPPRRTPDRHRSDPRGADSVVEGRRTLVGVGTLVLLVTLLVALLMITLTNGLAFFGLI